MECGMEEIIRNNRKNCIILVITQLIEIIYHSIGLNGKIYAMYYNIDLEYYFVYEMCRYRIGTTWSSVPDSLMTLKKILCLKVCLYIYQLCLSCNFSFFLTISDNIVRYKQSSRRY